MNIWVVNNLTVNDQSYFDYVCNNIWNIGGIMLTILGNIKENIFVINMGYILTITSTPFIVNIFNSQRNTSEEKPLVEKV